MIKRYNLEIISNWIEFRSITKYDKYILCIFENLNCFSKQIFIRISTICRYITLKSRLQSRRFQFIFVFRMIVFNRSCYSYGQSHLCVQCDQCDYVMAFKLLSSGGLVIVYIVIIAVVIVTAFEHMSASKLNCLITWTRTNSTYKMPNGRIGDVSSMPFQYRFYGIICYKLPWPEPLCHIKVPTVSNQNKK